MAAGRRAVRNLVRNVQCRDARFEKDAEERNGLEGRFGDDEGLRRRGCGLESRTARAFLALVHVRAMRVVMGVRVVFNLSVMRVTRFGFVQW